MLTALVGMAILQGSIQEAVDKAVRFGTLVYAASPESLAISARRLDLPASGGYREQEPFYPASVVKAFYLVFAGSQVASGKLKETPEVTRGLTDMIQESSNDATNWILEVITGATSGPELGEAELAKWRNKRRAVNRFFEKRGYTGLNASQKTWDWGPYGRERQGYGANFEERNSMSAAHITQLFADLHSAKVPSSAWALKFLRRTIPADDPKAGVQASSYIGKVLPAGSKLWSKAGWTDSVRHDAAMFELPNGHRYILTILTKGLSQSSDMIPDLAQAFLRSLGEL